MPSKVCCSIGNGSTRTFLQFLDFGWVFGDLHFRAVFGVFNFGWVFGDFNFRCVFGFLNFGWVFGDFNFRAGFDCGGTRTGFFHFEFFDSFPLKATPENETRLYLVMTISVTVYSIVM